MNGLYTVLLLILSNVFMTLAWYGHLRLQQTGISRDWPLIGVIVFSWAIAFLEYCCQVPANRIGFDANGGPFSLVQAQGNPGVYQPGGICHHSQPHVSGAVSALEPCTGLRAHHLCGISGIYEISSWSRRSPLPYLYNNVSTTLLYKLHEPVAHIDTPLSYLRYHIIAKQRYLKRIDIIFYQHDTCEDYADSELRFRPTYDFYLVSMSSGKSMDLLR